MIDLQNPDAFDLNSVNLTMKLGSEEEGVISDFITKLSR